MSAIRELLQTAAPEKREALLRDQADSSETKSYYKDLIAEEVLERKETFMSNNIDIAHHDRLLKSAKAQHKADTAHLKEENKQLLEEVTTRRAYVEGNVYHIADQESGVMETYDHNGEFVESRRLRKDERQLRMAIPLKKSRVNNF